MSPESHYDVFISHAHEDKEVFVRPLADRLIELGIRVWYDELSLQIGDSLRLNIDRGLNNSSYGVVVLSPSFLSKQWPERELNGLVHKAMIEGRKVILPIWHNVTHQIVAEYSLPLADLMAANSDNGVEHVAEEILRVVQNDSIRSDNQGQSQPARTTLVTPRSVSRSSTGGNIAMPSHEATTPIHEERARYSRLRLEDLRSRLQLLSELKNFPNLAVFAAGSYARLEASKYSDIDLFFVATDARSDIEEPHTKELRLFGKVIEIVDDLRFPKFSNDCQYLIIAHSGEIVAHLGGPSDDYRNFFTTRMLILLESHCLYGKAAYDEISAFFVRSYFVDYPDHRQTFQPVFLFNDIHRYWKTILLNYEHKRSESSAIQGDDATRTKQKVRNFKLKYS
ncbi:MAG: TIR domain-containing protein, partial [Dehalococcoidia bacterium]|nr:TIR domain-containing protein [Dehalococcoidia bacterium]